jgi:trehalose 6-phosphate synthase
VTPAAQAQRFVVCTHRGPVSHVRNDAGTVKRASGPGGVVATIAPALEELGGTWLFAPASEEDRRLARTGGGRSAHGNFDCRILDLPRRAHADHYETISGTLLAPLFHYLPTPTGDVTFARRIEGAWIGYRRVNEIYGDAIRRERSADAVLVDDTHLMLAGAAARRRPGDPDRPLLYFHHVPWCEPAQFARLSEGIRTEILSSMLMFDSVGFHCRRWADAFESCCERFLAGARANGDHVVWRGRRTDVAVLPAAVDARHLCSVAATVGARDWRRRFSELADGRRIVVRTERADPAKNALRGFEAYEALLRREPDLADRTVLLAVLTPVRTWADHYRTYLEACARAATRLNRRYGGDRQAIVLHLSRDAHAFDLDRALAAMQLADVLVVNPLYDGLNLVAMEGLVVGDPALVLSRNAGVHDVLADYAQSVDPFDVGETADAIAHGLRPRGAERRGRLAALKAAIASRTPRDWLLDRLARCN